MEELIVFTWHDHRRIRDSPRAALRGIRALIGLAADARPHPPGDSDVMHARAVEAVATELSELRIEERGGTALALVVLAASVGSTQIAPALALPLFAGGIYALVRTLRAALRRASLLDDLAAERDAYTIPEVANRGLRDVQMTSRRYMAASLRASLQFQGALSIRSDLCRDAIERLASELDDDDLVLDPTAAAVCRRLVTNDGESPLFDADLGADELLSRLHHIHAGLISRHDDTREPHS